MFNSLKEAFPFLSFLPSREVPSCSCQKANANARRRPAVNLTTRAYPPPRLFFFFFFFFFSLSLLSLSLSVAAQVVAGSHEKNSGNFYGKVTGRNPKNWVKYFLILNPKVILKDEENVV